MKEKEEKMNVLSHTKVIYVISPDFDYTKGFFPLLLLSFHYGAFSVIVFSDRR